MGGSSNDCISSQKQQNGNNNMKDNNNDDDDDSSVAYKSTKRGCYFSLACSIGSMSLACGSLLQIPNTADRITLQRGLFLTSLGFIYFVSLTDFCNKYLLKTQHGQQLRKKYHLMLSDILEITNKIVSAIQAFFSFLVGFIVCKSTCSKSFVYASHFLMEAYGWFGTAYFMYDIWSMYKVHTQKITDKLKLMRLKGNTSINGRSTSNGYYIGGGGRNQQHTTANGISSNNLYDKMNANGKFKNSNDDDIVHNRQHADEIYDDCGEIVQLPNNNGNCSFFKYIITHPIMIIHHIFIGTFGLLVVTYIRGGGHCIYSYMFMMEFSTPFVSLRSILSTMGLKDTRIYVINGLAMLATFFICRVFMWPYVMWRYSLAIDATFWQAMIGLPRGCLISISILFLPQIYWFYLMVKGALKVFFTTNKSQTVNVIDDGILKNNNHSMILQNKNNIINQSNKMNGNTKCEEHDASDLLTATLATAAAAAAATAGNEINSPIFQINGKN